jgi:hypothetical protein
MGLRIRPLWGLFVLVLGAPAPVAAQEATSNPEMTAIFEADQAARANPARIDWSVVGAEDEQRRARTKALLDHGALHGAFSREMAARRARN